MATIPLFFQMSGGQVFQVIQAIMELILKRTRKRALFENIAAAVGSKLDHLDFRPAKPLRRLVGKKQKAHIAWRFMLIHRPCDLHVPVHHVGIRLV
ncbi:MAG: hypothetical protein OXF66_01050 [Gammaproteobacteria bacterium]|nr:hypothetical protein [Gammaproteobacteria bacterium]